MSMTEAPFSVSFAPGKPPLVTVRGNNAAEAKRNLDEAQESGWLGAISTIQGSLNGRPQPAAAPANVTGPVEPASPASADDQQLPDSLQVKCSTCDGPVVLAGEGRSSTSGKPYRKYACTTSNLHKPTFTEA